MGDKIDPTNPGLIYENVAVPDDELTNIEPLDITMAETFGIDPNELPIIGQTVIGFDDKAKYTFRGNEELFFGLSVHKLHSDVPDIEFGTEHAACFDLRAFFHRETIAVWDIQNCKTVVEGYEKFALRPSERALIPTGMIIDIPHGYSIRVHPRSGNAVKHGINLINCEGVIDSDYTHQLFVPVMNNSNIDFVIAHGDRIAQAEIVPVMRYDIRYIDDAPDKKGNREGGFGSTGKS